jgi:hypothetical protein
MFISRQGNRLREREIMVESNATQRNATQRNPTQRNTPNYLHLSHTDLHKQQNIILLLLAMSGKSNVLRTEQKSANTAVYYAPLYAV